MTGSMDAVWMFPDLDIPVVAAACGQEFLESGIEVKGVDYWEAGVYVVTRVSGEEIVRAGLG